MSASPDGPPAPVDFWNEILAPKFIAWRHILVDGFAAHSTRIIPALGLRPGDRVLDVGCGFGDMAIDLARRVGPSGCVVGIDLCRAFLDIARSDAESASLDNVTFIEGDAQDFAFSPEYDLCFCCCRVSCRLRPTAMLPAWSWGTIASAPARP